MAFSSPLPVRLHHPSGMIPTSNIRRSPSWQCPHSTLQTIVSGSAAFVAGASRLPREAEWERAARGGAEGKLFPWGNDPPQSLPDYEKLWQKGPEPVAQGAPNGYGQYDICANVHEWCSDWYQADFYAGSPDRNPTGPDQGSRRASRGGSWRHHIKGVDAPRAPAFLPNSTTPTTDSAWPATCSRDLSSAVPRLPASGKTCSPGRARSLPRTRNRTCPREIPARLPKPARSWRR